jgi:hypothetical protein
LQGIVIMIALISNLLRAMAACVLGGGVLWWVVEHAGPAQGTVVVHVTEADVTLSIDDDDFRIEGWLLKPIECTLPAGSHILRMKRGGRLLYKESFVLERGEEKILTAWCPPRGSIHLGGRGRIR